MENQVPLATAPRKKTGVARMFQKMRHFMRKMMNCMKTATHTATHTHTDRGQEMTTQAPLTTAGPSEPTMVATVPVIEVDEAPTIAPDGGSDHANDHANDHDHHDHANDHDHDHDHANDHVADWSYTYATPASSSDVPPAMMASHRPGMPTTEEVEARSASRQHRVSRHRLNEPE